MCWLHPQSSELLFLWGIYSLHSGLSLLAFITIKTHGSVAHFQPYLHFDYSGLSSQILLKYSLFAFGVGGVLRIAANIWVSKYLLILMSHICAFSCNWYWKTLSTWQIFKWTPGCYPADRIPGTIIWLQVSYLRNISQWAYRYSFMPWLDWNALSI